MSDAITVVRWILAEARAKDWHDAHDHADALARVLEVAEAAVAVERAVHASHAVMHDTHKFNHAIEDAIDATKVFGAAVALLTTEPTDE